MLLRSLGSLTTWHVATLLRSLVWVGGWGWAGWGGMLTFLVLRTWYIAMLLRSLGSLTTWHVATLLRCHAIPALLAVALWVPYWQLAVEDSFHTDGSLSRRRVLNKIWASTSDAHDVYLICQKSIDFASTFLNQNSVIQRVRKSILYCKLQVIVTLLEANNQNAHAVSHPPGCLCIHGCLVPTNNFLSSCKETN